MKEQVQLIANSKIMAAMTALSRVFGLFRDQMIAFLLGTTRLADIWATAFMLPNLFRRLIAEGAMSTAFIPLLAELEAEEREAQANLFMRAMFSMVLCAALVTVTVMILAMPWLLPMLLRVLRPTSAAVQPELYAQMVLPTRIMFPYLVFISLAAVCQGVLNVKNRFALAAATPLVLNICIIGFGLGLRNWLGNPLWGLCCGVLAGGFLQFFLQWCHLYRLGFRLLPVLGFWNKRAKEAIRLWLPTTFSAGIVQINALVSTVAAVNLVEGAAISLYNSNRMIELVLGVFAASLTTALLPVLARQRSRADQAGLQASLWMGLSLMTVISLPAGLGLIVAGPSLISFLFQRGSFDSHGVALTCTALCFHAMALVPIAWYRILSQTFYAHKQVRITVWIAAIAALLNIAGCFVLPRYFDPRYSHCGIALATVLSSWVLFSLGLFHMRRRFALIWPRWFTWDLLKTALAAAAFLPLWLPVRARSMPTFEFLLKICLSVAIFSSLALVFKVSAMRPLLEKNKQ